MKPEFTHARYDLGLTYFVLGRHAEAAEEFRHAVRLEPRKAQAQYHLGLAYQHLGDKTAAAQQYNILKDLDPALAAELQKALR